MATNNDKYLLAYARKHKKTSLVEAIQKDASRRPNKVRERMGRFRAAIRTARQAGNKQMENRIREQFARTGDVSE